MILKRYYSGLVKLTLKEAFAYRVNFLFSFLVEFVPLIAFILLVKYIYSANNSISNYSFEKAITYYVFVRFFSDAFTPVTWFDITNDIRSGTLNFHISKPYSYFWHNFVVFYSLKIVYYLVSCVVLLIISIFLRKHLFIPHNLTTYFLFIISIFLSTILTFQISYIFSILSFWLINNSFIDNLFSLLFPFLTGVIIPLDIFPNVLQKIIFLLPTSYLIFLPSKIFLERYQFQSVIYSFGIIIVWILFLYIIIKILWIKGIKKYEAVG